MGTAGMAATPLLRQHIVELRAFCAKFYAFFKQRCWLSRHLALPAVTLARRWALRCLGACQGWQGYAPARCQCLQEGGMKGKSRLLDASAALALCCCPWCSLTPKMDAEALHPSNGPHA